MLSIMTLSITVSNASAVMLTVIMLNVAMSSVMAPLYLPGCVFGRDCLSVLDVSLKIYDNLIHSLEKPKTCTCTLIGTLPIGGLALGRLSLHPFVFIFWKFHTQNQRHEGF
jgi:hypothetical protein